MIVSLKSKKLERAFENDDQRGLPRGKVDKIKRILARLDEITQPSQMNLPGFGLHPLKGNRAGQWSVEVSGNWRIVFRVEEGNVHEVDLIDYHGK